MNEENKISPMDSKNSENRNEESNNKTSTFNLIIGIATLLIAILGATFAYFSATARSAENDVTVKSAYVSISYDGGTEIKATNLIPSTIEVAMNKYNKPDIPAYNPETDGEIITDYDAYKNNLDRRCVDAKGKEVCYVYQFSVKSDGAEGEYTDILASIKINKNEFQNLSYIIYEVTFKTDPENLDAEGNPAILKDKYGFGLIDRITPVGVFKNVDTNPDNVNYQDDTFGKFSAPEDIYEGDAIVGTTYPVACLFGETDDADTKAKDDTSRCRTYSLKNKEKHYYQVVIWLEETGAVQEEQGKSMEGTVTIEVSGGVNTGEYEDGKITGQQ